MSESLLASASFDDALAAIVAYYPAEKSASEASTFESFAIGHRGLTDEKLEFERDFGRGFAGRLGRAWDTHSGSLPENQPKPRGGRAKAAAAGDLSEFMSQLGDGFSDTATRARELIAANPEIAAGLGLGAGIGGLSWAMSPRRKQQSLLSRLATGALMGGLGGAAFQYVPQLLEAGGRPDSVDIGSVAEQSKLYHAVLANEGPEAANALLAQWADASNSTPEQVAQALTAYKPKDPSWLREVARSGQDAVAGALPAGAEYDLAAIAPHTTALLTGGPGHAAGNAIPAVVGGAAGLAANNRRTGIGAAARRGVTEAARRVGDAIPRLGPAIGSESIVNRLLDLDASAFPAEDNARLRTLTGAVDGHLPSPPAASPPTAGQPPSRLSRLANRVGTAVTAGPAKALDFVTGRGDAELAHRARFYRNVLSDPAGTADSLRDTFQSAYDDLAAGGEVKDPSVARLFAGKEKYNDRTAGRPIVPIDTGRIDVRHKRLAEGRSMLKDLPTTNEPVRRAYRALSTNSAPLGRWSRWARGGAIGVPVGIATDLGLNALTGRSRDLYQGHADRMPTGGLRSVLGVMPKE